MCAFRIRLILSIILLTCFGSWGESLWTPGFQGYLGGEATIRTGDIIFVDVDATSALSFSSSSSDSKNITLEFSGGEFGDLFSFLPVATASGEQSLKGKGEYSLKSLIAARAVEIDSSGKILIQGTRMISLEGKEESLTLTGWLDPYYLGPVRQVKFSQLADAQLQFRTFLQPASETLTEADIEEIIQSLESVSAEVSEGPEASTSEEYPLKKSYQLSEAKKKELFLRYINRLVDLIFQ